MQFDYLLGNYRTGYIKVNSGIAELVQSFLFSYGYCWYNSKTFKYLYADYIYIDKENFSLSWGNLTPSTEYLDITNDIFKLIESSQSYEYW